MFFEYALTFRPWPGCAIVAPTLDFQTVWGIKKYNDGAICEVECVLNRSLGFKITRVDVHGQGGTIKLAFFWYIDKEFFSFSSFLIWPLLPTHWRGRGLLLHLTARTDTYTLSMTPLVEGSVSRKDQLQSFEQKS